MTDPSREKDRVLAGGGQMGEMARQTDWSRTALGPVESWSGSLKTMAHFTLNAPQPIILMWGPELVQLYNDTYQPVLGPSKHPRAMGQRASECWAEICDVVGPLFEKVMQGGSVEAQRQLFLLERYGFIEESYFDYSYSGVRGESGRVEGIACVCNDNTTHYLAQRRLRALGQLGGVTLDAKSPTLAAQGTATVLGEVRGDVPFALIYFLDASGTEAELNATVGLTPGDPAAPLRIHLDAETGTWPLRTDAGELTLELSTLPFAAQLPGGPWPEPPRRAIVHPLRTAENERPRGFFVCGLSPRLRFDDAYQDFLRLVARQLLSALRNADAYAAEKRRVDELAELDRQKTSFFNNVSHEFRTPLTLMLGPTEEALASADRALRGADLETVHRNELRLLKLVNTLLDFSRIEAGRVTASYQPTDLAALTSGLASSFRSTLERAGLRLTVECEPLREPVWVDEEMWEKILLNLLSNAFKFTFEGGVAVRLRAVDGNVELTVEDTGTGIPEGDLPRLFERFHRVEGARGRSFEGSGIGLALVQELVKLHGATLRVKSRMGEGTAFTVSLPRGNAHLPAEQLRTEASPPRAATRADTFVSEASAWLHRSPETPVDAITQAEVRTAALARPQSAPETPEHILVVDDNADMRDYVRRLLQGRYEVTVAEDGRTALDSLRARPPDIVLSDVMMQGMNGFELLRAVRSDPATAGLPVILLSARAGEEATVEGIQAGATDYLVKPFSARELLARVEGTLQLARLRARLTEALEAMGDAFYIADREWNIAVVNDSLARMTQRSRTQMLGYRVWDVFPESAALDSKHRGTLERCMKERVPVRFVDRSSRLEVWMDVRAYPTPEGIAVFIRDVSDEKRAEAALQRQAEFEQQLVGIVSHDLRNPLQSILLGTSSLLRRDDLDARATKAVVRVQASADRAIRLVRDLLDFTQARLGKGIPILRREMDLQTAVEMALEDIRAEFLDRTLRLLATGDAQGSWDGDRLTQVVHNLVTNALKYSPPQTPVDVRLQGEAGAVLLEVHNQGAPIPPELLPELFKPLTRGNPLGERKGGSIGLGLFIVEQLVRAHDGAVSVRSTAEEGTTFSVRLPREP